MLFRRITNWRQCGFKKQQIRVMPPPRIFSEYFISTGAE